MDLGQRNKVDTQSSMSSMTDLVFLLLIFFILLSTQVVNGEKVDLPSTESSKSVEGGSVTLTITADGVYQINGREIQKNQLQARMKAEFFGTPIEECKVIFNVDKAVPTGDTIEALGIVKQNGWDAVIATQKK